MHQPRPTPTLRRDIGLFGATMLGLGSIIGTGVFISIAMATGIAGPAVILATLIAAAAAACNALSSAQLAAAYPVSGGTYEYAYRLLTPALGFTAGWMFLAAKASSGASAALGFAGYTIGALGIDAPPVILALGAIILFVAIVLVGIKRSSHVNTLIVGVTIATLAFFIGAGLPKALSGMTDNLTPFFEAPGDTRPPWQRLLEASALTFVAYTGYGRIATLGEEVRDPERTIPRAIIMTLLVSMTLYVLVAGVGISAVGADTFNARTTGAIAPLQRVARAFNVPGAGAILAIGAVTAMLGVLLNLILGLSRMLMAMGRRNDVPHLFARVNAKGTAPVPAVIGVGIAIAAIAAIGSIKIAWSFSAFTILIYYAITNIAALRLPRDQRRYHPAVAWLGLASCLGLAFWVEPRVWITGLALIGAGLLIKLAFNKLQPTPT